MACSVWAIIRGASTPAFSTRPPVSTTMQGTSVRRANPYCRSRVNPGRSATSASRVPVMALNSVDLPTFGRPISATTGSTLRRLFRRRRRAEGGHAAAVSDHDHGVVDRYWRVAGAILGHALARHEFTRGLVQPMQIPLIVRDHDGGAGHRGRAQAAALQLLVAPQLGTVALTQRHHRAVGLRQ